MSEVNRSDLLQRLLAVQPGCALRDSIGGVQQSSCLILRNGWCYTLNREIACAIGVSLKTITGAVHAQTVISLLKSLNETMISVTEGVRTLNFASKTDRTQVPLEPIMQPAGVDRVERPTEWLPLHNSFSEAVALCERCTKKRIERREEFAKACLHIHPEWVEASDNDHAARYTLTTFVKSPVLVRATTLKELIPLGCTQASETSKWLHFRNPMGLRFSVRKFEPEQYPDLSPFFDLRGRAISLPRGLKDAAVRAGIVADAGKSGKLATVTINGEQVLISSSGVMGSYESERVSTSPLEGGSFTFKIPCKLLAELTQQQGEVEVTNLSIRVSSGNYVYVSSLSQ